MANAAAAANAKAAPVKPAGGDEARMPFMLHLKELRDRLIRSVIAVVITTGISLFFLANRILELLIRLAPEGTDFYGLRVTENISVWFKMSLWSGVILAMPVLVYQFFAYIAPGLTSKEKRLVYFIIPFVTVMFLAGVAFAYFVALPNAIGFLIQINSDIATPMISIEDYVNVVTRLILVIGLVFETPVIVMALARLGVVSPQWLGARRRLWFVAAFVIAALVTPTMDPINQAIIAIPLIILLELGILLARLVYKKKRDNPLASSEAA